ncbi:MAG TPA: hypothetical protein VEA99_14520 [Gemmatimonadaceae bacterium]|nr:hypothetical protein [Gemmatimonadaceae bacterium]
MTAGLPGAGIGGLFYLASALLMPMRSLVLTLRGRGDEARWALAFRQSAMAAGVLLALWGTGLALGAALDGARVAARSSGGGGGLLAKAPTEALGAHALAFSIGTLLVVLLAVQIARAVVPQRPPRPADPPRDERLDDRSAA